MACTNGEEEDLVEFSGSVYCRIGGRVLSEGRGMGRFFYFGLAAAEALVKHAVTLGVFRLESDHRCKYGAIDHLHCSLPNLKELSIVGNSMEDRRRF